MTCFSHHWKSCIFLIFHTCSRTPPISKQTNTKIAVMHTLLQNIQLLFYHLHKTKLKSFQMSGSKTYPNLLPGILASQHHEYFYNDPVILITTTYFTTTMYFPCNSCMFGDVLQHRVILITTMHFTTTMFLPYKS